MERLESLIVLFLENRSSLEEEKELKRLLENNGNRTFFEEYVRLNHLINTKNKLHFKKSPKLYLKKNFSSTSLLKYAAFFVGLITIVYSFSKDTAQKKENSITFSLELEGQEDKKITQGVQPNTIPLFNLTNNNKILLKKSNENYYKLVYAKKDSSNTKTLIYNTLSVPYGERFKIELSDGSKIHLNAGSTLKYPIEFIEGKSREVYLTGEGYFEITKNNEDSFIVHTNTITTKVYGTIFNITSYTNEDEIKIVLAEGSIGIFKNENTEEILKPNQIATYSKSHKNITIKKADIANSLAWIDGVLLFKNLKFKILLNRLERNYNVSITNKSSLGEEYFTGRFETEAIDEILNTFKIVKKFNYNNNNNRITITD